MDAVFPTRLDSVIDNLLPHCIPWKFCSEMLVNDKYITNLLEPFSDGDTTQCDTAQCYFTSTPPETLDWKQAYNDNSCTKTILSKLLQSDCIKWNEEELHRGRTFTTLIIFLVAIYLLWCNDKKDLCYQESFTTILNPGKIQHIVVNVLPLCIAAVTRVTAKTLKYGVNR